MGIAAAGFLRNDLWLLLAALALPGAAPAQAATEKATFAGGCFWCVEADFDKVPGVLSTTSGYIGGKVANPSYEQVANKGTGHAEAVEIVYDPKVVSYEQLVEYFWRTIDPTDPNGVFCDQGASYRTAVFATAAQRPAAEASRAAAAIPPRPFRPPPWTRPPAGPAGPGSRGRRRAAGRPAGQVRGVDAAAARPVVAGEARRGGQALPRDPRARR